MAKRREEIENPILTPVITFRRPDSVVNETPCKCGCRAKINCSMDDYIIIDGEFFADDYCVTDHYIKEAGGRRVYGGAC
ncbi:hypothetical protein D3C77_493580 [compost metagenome]